MYGLGLDSLRFLLTHCFYIYSNPNPSFPVILTQNLRRVRVRITNMYGLGLELRRGLGLGEEICIC